MNFTRIGGRKFVLCVLSLIAASILLWLDKLSEGGYISLIGLTVAAYVAGATIDNKNKQISG